MFNLEKALSTWRHQYKYSRAFKGRDLDELEQHLRDQVVFLVDAGRSEEDAFREAIAELGTFHETESEFRSVAWMKTRDRNEMGQEMRHQITMIASYLRIAARNLRKNRVPSLINLVGLSVAIAVTMVSYTYVSAMLTRDHYHDHAEDIFLVHQITQEEDGEEWWGHSPAPIGPAMAAESPSLERVVRITGGTAIVHDGENPNREFAWFADPEYFSMFSFPIKSGSFEQFGRTPGVVLSASQAVYFFGQEDPVGLSLDVTFPDGMRSSVPILAVMEEFRADAGLQVGFVFPMSRMASFSDDDWTVFADATFLQRRSDVEPQTMEVELNRYLDRVNAADEDWQVTRFELDNLKNLAWNRPNVNRSVASWIPMAPVIVLSLISCLLLLLACFNYMNISMATSTRRLREIGVRKAVGGSRGQLILQFLTENLELSLAAMAIGLLLAWQILLPGFSQIAGTDVSLGLTEHGRVWLFMGAIVVAVGLFAGAYPALYVSSFRPTAIFQGRAKLRSRRPLSHGFLAFQFLLAFLTMSAGIVLTMNGRYLAEKDWGFDDDQLVVIQADESSEFELVRATLEGHPGVTETRGSRDVVGFSYNEERATSVNTDLEGFETFVFGAEPDYLEFLGLELLQGSLLSDSAAGFGPEAIVINETFASTAGLEEPVGSVVAIDSIPRVVVGLVKDFHHQDFFSVIDPAVFESAVPEDHAFISARVATGSMSSVTDAVEAVYAEYFNGRDVVIRYQDQVFRDFQEESSGIATIFSVVAILALLISCLSIYALSAQNVLNRLKEIGVRKVLGGAPLGIAHLVNRRYVIIMTIGSLLALPLAWFGLDMLLNDIYAYAMELNVVPFLITYVIILGVSLLTITTQARTIRRTAPAEILRVD
jgi:ABC-type antimicrobial peptide transport system permease subunit